MSQSATSGPLELVAVFNKLNKMHFAGRLTARLEWSTRMRVIAGNCNWRQGVIRLSQTYHEQYPDELESTLLHEMLHLALQRGHDSTYIAAAAHLGVPLQAKGRAQHRPYKYVYACPGCGRQVKRRRKGVWSCGTCGGGKWDPRYRLRLKEYL